jgi:hypoxanthine phosphoribosyltransferase
VAPLVLLDEAAIAGHVDRLGREIARDHPGGVLLVGVLKGALIFLADLVRAVPDVDVEVDFISISRFAPDSGRVKILHDLEHDITGRDVVLVEDIVDTGLTLNYLMNVLRARNPRTLKVAALLSKPSRRLVEVKVDYIGFTIEDLFVVGYGLDYNEKYRNLADIVVYGG